MVGTIRVGVVCALLFVGAACSSVPRTSPSASTTSTTAPPYDCANLTALEGARLVEAELEAATAHPKCPTASGLQDRASKALAEVAVLKARAANQHGDAARALLLSAISIDAGDQALRDALTALDAHKSPDAYVTALRLNTAGYRTEAEKAVTDAITAGQPIPEADVARLDKKRGFWEAVRNDLWSNWLWVVVGTAVLVLFVYRMVRLSRIRRRCPERLPVWQPRLEFAAAGEASGPALAVLVRARIRELADQDEITGAKISGPPLAALDVPKLADVDSKFKILDALVAWALQPDKLVVSTRFPDSQNSGGRFAAFEMTDGRWAASAVRMIPTISAPENELGIAASFGAGWVAMQVRAQRPQIVPDSQQSSTTIGTENAQAFGCFLAGVTAYDSGSAPVAYRFFDRACRLDPMYADAASNRAVALGSDGSPTNLAAGAIALIRLLGPIS